MSGKAPIFEETVRNYLAQVALIDLAGISETLGITIEPGGALIPFLGITYRVSSSGVFDDSGLEPIHAIRMECLAIIGWLLADSLAQAAGLGTRSVM